MAFAARNEVCNKISLLDTGITATPLLASVGPAFDFDLRRQLFLPLSVWILWIDRRKGLSLVPFVC